MSGYVEIATAWLGGCSGCHVALLDLGDEIEDVLRAAKFVLSPLCDVREVPSSDVVLVEGCLSTEQDEVLLKELRDKCKTLVALGSCATCGGIPALRNAWTPAEVVSRSYAEAAGLDAGGTMPAGEPPRLRDRAQPIADLVSVDVEISGCPPTPEMIGTALKALLAGETPAFGTKNLCIECDRAHPHLHVPSRQFLADYAYSLDGVEDEEGATFLVPRREIFDEAVHALFELDEIDPGLCFLEQGIMCMGPATRQGCGAVCLQANYPCRGCFGPTPDMFEQGAKAMDALATILPPSALAHFEDLIGTSYRFCPPRPTCAKKK